ncbi:hypothetical protein [Bradyrhizobium sp. CCBAU 53415]|uniref:hypothetical protein n=1 Tax=Bradyrhizobium sp. CCBAU 53415 TaxID=1325119 RepID=UPI0023053D8E|nr:hypothetical protein [Bradyrhizobium sp. CCBAU 53415]
MRVSTKPQTTADIKTDRALIARGRLKEARQWFEHCGWKTLPRNDRLMPILRWGADHAHMADPSDPRRSVRRWCRRWAPWLDEPAIDQIIRYTKTSNKRWAADQCAAVLNITVRDRHKLSFRFIGACDDAGYEFRLNISRAKAAERSRRCRAKNSTGAKPGRPKSPGVKQWHLLGISRATYFRRKSLGNEAKSPTNETEKPSRHISKNIHRDGISVSRVQVRARPNLVKPTRGAIAPAFGQSVALTGHALVILRPRPHLHFDVKGGAGEGTATTTQTIAAAG